MLSNKCVNVAWSNPRNEQYPDVVISCIDQGDILQSNNPSTFVREKKNPLLYIVVNKNVIITPKKRLPFGYLPSFVLWYSWKTSEPVFTTIAQNVSFFNPCSTFWHLPFNKIAHGHLFCGVGRMILCYILILSPFLVTKTWQTCTFNFLTAIFCRHFSIVLAGLC